MNKKIKQDKIEKEDGLKNILTNLGVQGKSRTPSTSFSYPQELTTTELDNIYRGDGFGKKIINVYANEMTRQWISILNDPTNNMQSYLIKLKAKARVNEAIKWSRLYGGAVIHMMVDDGQAWYEPINFKTIRSVEKLVVYDLTEINKIKYYSDRSQQALFNEPEIYSISETVKDSATNDSGIIDIHHSRILRFDGEHLPNRLENVKHGWGDSVLQSMYSQLINMLQSYDYAGEMLHDFIISVIKIGGLANILGQPGGDKKIQNRIDLTAQTRSVNNMVVLDSDDDYDKKVSVIGGIANLIDKFVLALSAVSGIPQMVLMGQSPSGLNATGDNDIRNWYDSIKSEQEEILTDPINKLLDVIKAAHDSRITPAAKIEFVFNPMWQHSRDEIVAMQNTKAQTDQIYIQNGVYTSEAVQKHLIAGKIDFDAAILTKHSDPTFKELDNDND